MKRYFLFFLAVLVAFATVDFVLERLMLHGVNEIYGLQQHSQILLVGHSHLMLATDKPRMEKGLGMKISKYTREGVNVYDRKIMVKQFLDSPYSDSLKFCLYGVDLCTFTGEGLSQNSYMLFYPFIDDPNISQYIRQQASNVDYWTHKLIRSSRYNDDGLKNAAIRGWRHDWSNRKTGVIDIEVYKQRLTNDDERHITMNAELMSEFQQTVALLTSRGVKVVLVNTPTLDLLNDFEPEKYRQIVAWYTHYAEQNPMVEYWDFNPAYASRHELFLDRLHLNVKGQQVITDEIIKKFKVLLN